MNELPIVQSCDGCGACCFEQQSPPGYVMLLNSDEAMASDECKEDAGRVRNLPAEAIRELRDYIKKVLSGEEAPDSVCLWLDRQSLLCRYHHLRPSICREFEVGSDECLDWRSQYYCPTSQKDLPSNDD